MDSISYAKWYRSFSRSVVLVTFCTVCSFFSAGVTILGGGYDLEGCPSLTVLPTVGRLGVKMVFRSRRNNMKRPTAARAGLRHEFDIAMRRLPALSAGYDSGAGTALVGLSPTDSIEAG